MIREHQAPEAVALQQLADEFGTDRSNARKWMKRNGLPMIRVRSLETGGQAALAMTHEVAEQARALRLRQGFSLGGEGAAAGVPGGSGFFYLIQLVPDLSPNRVKLGYAGDVATRLASHRTAAPTAQLLRSWPCRPSWELAAIESITRVEAIPLSREVFDVESLEGLIERAEAFFGLMPMAEGRAQT